mmetsp:Transcript_14889/g.41146  ORF Transcript_14889/g.41146 Transcript_14889/m.41146 type:complete len:278 (+) Transcript_14889:313-1146(+)
MGALGWAHPAASKRDRPCRLVATCCLAVAIDGCVGNSRRAAAAFHWVAQGSTCGQRSIRGANQHRVFLHLLQVCPPTENTWASASSSLGCTGIFCRLTPATRRVWRSTCPRQSRFAAYQPPWCQALAIGPSAGGAPIAIECNTGGTTASRHSQRRREALCSGVHVSAPSVASGTRTAGAAGRAALHDWPRAPACQPLAGHEGHGDLAALGSAREHPLSGRGVQVLPLIRTRPDRQAVPNHDPCQERQRLWHLASARGGARRERLPSLWRGSVRGGSA